MACEGSCRCDALLSRYQDWLLSEPDVSLAILRAAEQDIFELLCCAARNSGDVELRFYACMQLEDRWFYREGGGLDNGRVFVAVQR